MTRAPHRKTEFLLLLAVQIVLVFGLALVFLGKKATTDFPTVPININTATASQLAQTLSVDKETAKTLVMARGHGWPSVYSLHHAKALKNVPTAPINDRFVARTQSEAARMFWSGAVAFLLVFWIVHAILRKSAPKADPFLLPFTTLLSGLGLMLVYSVKDPYRDSSAFTGQVWGVALYGMIALLIPLTRPFGRLPLRRYQYAYAGAAVFLMLGLLVLGTGRAAFIFSCLDLSQLSLSRFYSCCLSRRTSPNGAGRSAMPKPLCRAWQILGRWPLSTLFASGCFCWSKI